MTPKLPLTHDLSARIRGERARLGLTQKQAAELAGMTRGMYKQLEEAPTRDIRLSTLHRLVGAGFQIEALAPELIK